MSVVIPRAESSLTVDSEGHPSRVWYKYWVQLSNAIPNAATPTHKVGATAVAGTASTFMRSDAAPALDLTVHYSFTGPIGVNGATPPAQLTGWGAPTGPAVVANYSGTAATLVQTSNAVAQIIAYLLSKGDFGA